ncbi:MAG: hypothetical protein AAGJ18_03595 [Bacteroidota bacterium]
MKWPFIICILFLGLSACQDSDQQASNNAPSIFDWLSKKEDIIQLEIKGDLNHLFGGLHEADHYHPAQLKLIRGDTTIQLTAKIARRGVTRRKICDFPPIKLKLSNDTLENKGFARFNDYKLVTHCLAGEDELVLKEYLTYKLFNQLTPKSFRVQLAKVRYVDQSGVVENEEYFAFLIEDNKELAHRLGGKLVNPNKRKISRVDKEQYKKMVLFQYMIGNTDWNLSKGHNVKWVQPKDSEVPIPIPYDFDYCGLVNAPYAVPHPQIPIKNVRQRYLQWRGKSKEVLLPVYENFKIRKADFIAVCQAFEDLSEEQKTDMLEFLESFFEEVDNQTFL